MAKNPYEFSYTMRLALRRKILKIAGFIIILSAVTSLFLSFVLFPAVIKTNTMVPSLHNGNFVFVSKISSPQSLFKFAHSIERSDIVYIVQFEQKKLSFLAQLTDYAVRFFTFQQVSPAVSMQKSMPVIRRVIGLPGDTVFVKNYTAYIKPADSPHFLTEFELSKRQYDICLDKNIEGWDTSIGVLGDMAETLLGSNEYFVLCDNRKTGLDSRIWGAVQSSSIRGKILIKYFPPGDVGIL